MRQYSTFKLGPQAVLFSDESLSIHGVALEEPFYAHLVDRPRGTGDYLLMCLHEVGQLGHDHCQAEEMMIWAPGQHQRYGNRERPIAHSWLHADGSWLTACLRRHRLPTEHRFASGSRFADLLRGIHAELTQQRPPDGLILRSLIEAWARDRALALHEPIILPSWLPRLRRWLYEHLAEEISIADCCTIAGLRRAQLCARFRALEGLTIGVWLQRRRLEQACQLLHDENISVAEAGAQVGYPDTSYFCKLFTRRYGSSPGKWRST